MSVESARTALCADSERERPCESDSHADTGHTMAHAAASAATCQGIWIHCVARVKVAAPTK